MVSDTRSNPSPHNPVDPERELWGLGTVQAKKSKGRKGKKSDATGRRSQGALRRDRRHGSKGDKDSTQAILRWRLYNIEIPLSLDPGKDVWGVTNEVGVILRKGMEIGRG